MTIDKKILAVGLTAAIMTFSSSAFATMSGYSANAQLSIADVSGFDSGMAIVLTGIKPMPSVNPMFAVEGEFTMPIDNPSTSYFGIGAEVSYFTLGGYGAMNYPLSPTVKLKGRAGLLYESIDLEVVNPFFPSQVITASDSGLEVSFGFGAVFNIGKEFDVIAEYTIIESDISHLGAGVQMKF